LVTSATDLRKVVIIDFTIFIIVQPVATVVSKDWSIGVADVTIRYQWYRASPLGIHVEDLTEMTMVAHYLRPLVLRAR
jgi:hypothetical protein